MKAFVMSALLAASSALAPAAVIFANGTPDLTQADARGITLFRSADDFTLGAAAGIDSVRFWMLATDTGFGGTLTYAFYQDAAGALGSVISSGTISNITPVSLGQVPAFIYYTYQVDFNLPSVLNLAAGTYWLEIHDGSDLTTDTKKEVYWSIANTGPGNALQSQVPTLPSGETGNALAFSLNGTLSTAPTGIPEPSTISISLAGLIALALLRTRSAR